MSSKKTKQKLTVKELAQLRAELAHAYFIFKKDKKSLRQARISISLSGHKNALAFWSGGLAAWRLGNIVLSKWFFNNLSNLEDGPESILSAGSFWSAKVAYHVGEYKNGGFQVITTLDEKSDGLSGLYGITSISKSRDGIYFVGGDGIKLYDPNSLRTITSYEGMPVPANWTRGIFDLLLDKDGSLWAASAWNGCLLYTSDAADE